MMEMSKILLEILEPQIKEIVRKAEIKGAIKASYLVNRSDEEIKEYLAENYELSLEEAEKYMKQELTEMQG